ncbi:cellulase [Ranunculus cassubicifolius]
MGTTPAVDDGLNSDCPGLPPIDTSSERSWVWGHVKKCYAKVSEEVLVDGKKKNVESIVLKAKCNYCHTLMACEEKGGGTSTYSKHILKNCKKYTPNVDLQQKTLGAGGSKTLVDGDLRSTLTSRAWSHEACVKSIVEFIVIDEQPFCVVEKLGFRRMFEICVPALHVPFRRSIVREFWKYYDQEKTALMRDLRKYRVSFTTDTWTSVQNINYMVLTAHFVDDEWVMHKRILNFCTIPSHQGKEIGKLIEQCLIEWKVEKIMCISVDNASANKVAIDWLVGKMRNWPRSPLILEGKYIMVRCLAHVLNLVVKDGLARMDNSVASIRKAVKFVRSSPARFEYFKKCMHAEKIDGSGILVMDVATRWNSTYLMLESVLKYRKVFDRM